jgi:hypothetical protein
MHPQTTKKPGRPFGVILAILLCIVFFSIIPGAMVTSRVLIEQHVTRSQMIMLPDGTLTEITSGVDDDSVLGNRALQIQLIISVGFLVLSVFAWRGKPAWMRYVFMFTVLAIAGILLYQNFILFRQQTHSGGTGEAFFQFLQNANILALVLVPLYVIWYLNRAPARAFYLQEEIATLNTEPTQAD